VRWLAGIVVLLVAVITATRVSAHEVRPAYLQIDEAGGNFTVVWKQPTLGEFAVHLVPHVSNGWLESQPADQYVSNGFLIRTWKVPRGAAVPAGVDPAQALAGRVITIEGLEQTITDVFVRVHLEDGPTFEGIVHPQSPQVRIDFGNSGPRAVPAFLVLGIEHILSGPDHLLFVLGLLLLVRSRLMLLKTVTGFTAAHSLTLACATVGAINLPVPLLNTLIAASILFLAPEVLRARQGGHSFTIRYPWAVAFLFGLLHGLGFASGLSVVGLDGQQLVLALVLFNVGVEVGQLAFVALILGLQRAFRLLEIRWPRAVALAPGYLIGTLGASWTFQYGALALGWA